MQQQMRARMVAQQLAMARERMTWWAWFYGISGVGLLAGYVTHIIDDVRVCFETCSATVSGLALQMMGSNVFRSREVIGKDHLPPPHPPGLCHHTTNAVYFGL